MQSKTCKTIKIVLASCILFFFITIIHSRSAFAATYIKSSQIKLVADFELLYKANAGGTITKDYYVYPDTRGSHGGSGTLLWVVDRKTCKVTDSTKLKVSYLSGVYNKWGTDYITLIAMGKQNGCYKLKGSKLVKSSSCPTPPTRKLSYQGTGQGNTATYNGHTFKVAGYHGGMIGVWNSSGSRVGTFVIPKNVLNLEPENISIDGDTGEVYINYAKKVNGKRHSVWYKIDSSVFSKYTGKKGNSNPTLCKNNSPMSQSANSSSSEDNPSSISKNDKTNLKAPTYAPSRSTYNGEIDTTFFGTVQDDGNGCGVYTVLSLVLDIMTIGIGVLAVLGIIIAGITYLTAGGDVTRATKAKRRIYEIIIGLLTYAALWTILTFLIPEFNPELQACQQSEDTSQSAE